MGSLIQRGKKGIYTAVWWQRNTSGQMKLKFKSTGTPVKTKAKQIAAVWFDLAQGTKVSQDFARRTATLTRALSSEAEIITPKEWVARWLAERKLEVGASTNDAYAGKTKDFLLSLGKAAEADLSLITAAHIRKFRFDERSRVAASTANNSLKIIGMLFREAVARGLLATDPCEGIERFNVDTLIADDEQEDAVERRPFELWELQRLMAAANDEWQSLIMFGLYTGQRLGDLCRLKWGQVDLLANVLLLRKTRKTKRVTYPPIPEALKDWILARSVPDDPQALIHPKAYSQATKRKGGQSSVSNQFGTLLTKIGLRPPVANGKKTPNIKRAAKGRRAFEISFHSLRHTYVSWMKRAGAPAAVTMDAVGHDSAAINDHYTHIDDATKRKFADLLPRLTP